jgi:hypothetical protein
MALIGLFHRKGREPFLYAKPQLYITLLALEICLVSLCVFKYLKNDKSPMPGRFLGCF